MAKIAAAAEYVKCVLELQNISDSTHCSRELISRVFKTLFTYDVYSTIRPFIKLEGHKLSLECLWEIQNTGYMYFTAFISHNPHLIPSLAEKFDQLIWDEFNTQHSAEIVAGLLEPLVVLGPDTCKKVFVPGHKMKSLIIDQFLEKLLANTAEYREPVPFLCRLGQNSWCTSSLLCIFSLTLLRAIVQHNPDLITLEEAVANQATLYTCKKGPPSVRQVFVQILSYTTEDAVIQELNRIITSKDKFNWCWLLIFVSVYNSNREDTESFKELVGSWVTQACANKDSTLLSAALLCARQACIERTEKFGSYSSWFGNLHVRPAPAFVFFFSFLSELVPHEPVLCLKVHVNKVPSAPANCHQAIGDYVTLAKTRLADLNQTTDFVGLFGEYTTTEQEGREADIAKVINHYNLTKEVMKIVLEASVFRRQFYEKVFLTELLKNNNPDHVEFIEKLFSMGKVLPGLYEKWKLTL